MKLVSSEWLSKNINKVKILDASWHLKKDRNALKEYKKKHIESAIFIDLEEVSNQSENLSHGHFLPKKEKWEEKLSQIGISNSSTVIIYDNSDLISSCRMWFQFLYFGHDPNLVFVLNTTEATLKLVGDNKIGLKYDLSNHFSILSGVQSNPNRLGLGIEYRLFSFIFSYSILTHHIMSETHNFEIKIK